MLQSCAAFTLLLALSQASAVPKVPTVKLNNAVEMPVAAFAAQLWDDDTCKTATAAALQAGFRFVWSSALIGQSCQAAQGAAITASGLPRSELFMAGTVNTQGCGDMDSCKSQTATDAEGQFTALGVTQLDMLMLDYPAGSCDGIKGQWAAFEAILAAKRVRTIAVSNFSPDQIKCITANASSTAPSVNQMSYSVGNGGTVVADDGKLGVVVQAYSPLGGGSVVSNQACVDIGKQHNKSAAQVGLRWIYQTKATFATQSTNPAHLTEDIDIFDNFELSDAEVARLNQGVARSSHVVV
jgi:diketogulonate reductase-like aldo/keto reductase